MTNVPSVADRAANRITATYIRSAYEQLSTVKHFNTREDIIAYFHSNIASIQRIHGYTYVGWCYLGNNDRNEPMTVLVVITELGYLLLGDGDPAGLCIPDAFESEALEHYRQSFDFAGAVRILFTELQHEEALGTLMVRLGTNNEAAPEAMPVVVERDPLAEFIALAEELDIAEEIRTVISKLSLSREVERWRTYSTDLLDSASGIDQYLQTVARLQGEMYAIADRLDVSTSFFTLNKTPHNRIDRKTIYTLSTPRGYCAFTATVDRTELAIDWDRTSKWFTEHLIDRGHLARLGVYEFEHVRSLLRDAYIDGFA